MNTAIKTRSIQSPTPKIEMEFFSSAGLQTLNSETKEKAIKTPDIGKNTRRLQMIMADEQVSPDVFELFGWGDLPESVKSVIRLDMELYRDELLGLYSTCQQGVKDRRKSISYWVKVWRDGLCSEETVVQSLSASF